MLAALLDAADRGVEVEIFADGFNSVVDVYKRQAPAKVLHLDGLILVPGDDDQVAVALPGLVDGVGEDLEHRVLAALQPVRAENHPGPLPHPVGPRCV